MWNYPALINRIAMKATRQLVINPATRHLLERDGEDLLQFRGIVRSGIVFVRTCLSNVHVETAALGRLAELCSAQSQILIDQQTQKRGGGNFWPPAETAMIFVKHLYS